MDRSHLLIIFFLSCNEYSFEYWSPVYTSVFLTGSKWLLLFIIIIIISLISPLV